MDIVHVHLHLILEVRYLQLTHVDTVDENEDARVENDERDDQDEMFHGYAGS